MAYSLNAFPPQPQFFKMFNTKAILTFQPLMLHETCTTYFKLNLNTFGVFLWVIGLQNKSNITLNFYFWRVVINMAMPQKFENFMLLK